MILPTQRSVHLIKVISVCTAISLLNSSTFLQGDCCGSKDYSHCAFCLCKHSQPELRAMQFELGFFYNGTCPLGLVISLADGYCHDELNTYVCQYDGGDCCKPLVLGNVCSQCICFNSNGGKVTSTIMPSTKEQCPDYLSHFVGDDQCHDATNTPQCNYDGGDCCGPIELTFCTDCLCIDPKNIDLPRGN